MPYFKFIINDSEDHALVAKQLKRFLEHIYDVQALSISPEDENEIFIDMYVPGRLKRAEFEEDMNEFCNQHNCSFELVNQAPEAPSPQYFSENMRLMYPRVKKYEDFAKNPKKLEIAKRLWKENWGNVPFDETSLDDQEDMVLLYNMYMDEMSEWKPVWIKLKFKPEEVNEIDEIDFEEPEEVEEEK